MCNHPVLQIYYLEALLACVQRLRGKSTQSRFELCALMFEDRNHQNIQVVLGSQETLTLPIYAGQEFTRTTDPLRNYGVRTDGTSVPKCHSGA